MNIRLAAGSAWLGVPTILGLLVTVSVAEPRQIQFSSPGPPRDRLQPPPLGTNALNGRVVDGVTGAPVPRARVRIVGGGGPRPSVVTDASGGFAFARLPAGSYTLAVEKVGYLPASFPERGRGLRSVARPLILQDRQALQSIAVPLYRGGVITGRVVDASGEPVEWVEVRAFKAPAGARGRRRPVNGGAASTNDIGEFRLARLDTGSYVLMAMPQRTTGPDEPGLEAQPAPTYYPNVDAVEQAQAVAVNRGQTVSGIDISMGEVFMGVVTGTVIDPSGQPVTNNARISITSVDSDGFGSGISTSLRPDGTFRARVAPGDYTLEASVTPPMVVRAGRTEPDLVGVESVTVTSGASETVLITLGKGATASGRVVFDGMSPPPPNPGQIRIPLMDANGRRCNASLAEIASDWSFTVESLTGTCMGQSFGVGRWMLKAVMVDGEDLLDRPVTFTPGQQYRDVQVVFTDRRAEIGFHVSAEDGQATRDYVAVVFPADRARWNMQGGTSAARPFVPPQADAVVFDTPAPGATPAARAPVIPQPRREVMVGLRSGEYLAIALDNIEYDEMRDPTVLEKLAAAATRVTLGDRSPVEVPLRRVKLADVLR
jgi:protocatechuate 3,4-dioxygenase beta subunit